MYALLYKPWAVKYESFTQMAVNLFESFRSVNVKMLLIFLNPKDTKFFLIQKYFLFESKRIY